ncbi:hypothetical protein KAR91_07655 [Candidatus Pacearchaeota archaeon]|nr:hypothetical protein [Candidatus Pacearchaeota archaeon]
MTEQKHTKEPWSIREFDQRKKDQISTVSKKDGAWEFSKRDIIGPDSERAICSVVSCTKEDSAWSGIKDHNTAKENARRISAAVNACTGIPTEALESGVVGELVDVCEAIDRDHDDAEGAQAIGKTHWCWLRMAIDKLKGENNDERTD